MPLVHDDHVVQAFSANTSDNPFRIAVLARTPGGYRNLSDTQSIDSCREILAVDPYLDLALSREVRCRRESLPQSAVPFRQRSGVPRH